MVRAACDIGSGEHKLVIAKVVPGNGNGQLGKVQEVLSKRADQVLLGYDYVSRYDGCIGEEMLQKSKLVLQAYAEEASKFGALSLRGACTAVFRRAKNGPDYLESVKSYLSLPTRIDVVDQSVEGELGFLTATALRPCSDSGESRPLICWDSGGGSYQISTQREDGGLHVLEGRFGCADATKKGMEVQGREYVVGESLNPMPVASLYELEQWVYTNTVEPPEWLSKCLRNNAEVVGIGGATSIFCAAHSVAQPRSHQVPVHAVHGSLEMVAEQSDAGVSRLLGMDGTSFPEVGLVPAKLAIVAGVMRKLGMTCMTYVKSNGSCEGMLLWEKLWE